MSNIYLNIWGKSFPLAKNAYTLPIADQYLLNRAHICKAHLGTRTLFYRTRIKLSDTQSEQMQLGFSMLEHNINMPETPNKSKKIDTMMLLLVYSICDMMDGENNPIREQTFSPKDNLMERFFRLLKMSNPTNSEGLHLKSVKQYASQLNVTPKYLSTVCKNSIGKTASQIIDENVISSAKILLHDNNYSIKQIADLLGFANQSHFGTFFRRETGCSPQNYRSNNTVFENK